jgi:hypothetical protein
LEIADWALRVVDCRLDRLPIHSTIQSTICNLHCPISNLQSKIPTLQSATCNPQ